MYKKIMVPVDGSKLAECVFPHIETMVRACDESSEVLFVQAVEPMAIPYGIGETGISSIEQLKAFEAHNKADAEKYLKDITARFKENGINATAEVIYGKATEALGDFVTKNNIDLVIISTHGRSGVSRWVWGSVTDRLLRSICVPVFMVRAPECVPDI